MATKPKPKPKDLRSLMGTSSLAGTVAPGYGQTQAIQSAKNPTLQDIADAFGGAANAKAYSDALAAGPPVGSYDPQLDIQGTNERNNYIWGGQDRDTTRERTGQDYQSQIAQRDTTHGYSLSDLFKQGGRDLEDYNTATGNLNTQYQRQGVSQTQSANAAGVGGGGALVAAAAARAGNQAHDQSGLDTTWARQQQDIQQGINRENDAYTADRITAPGTGAPGGLMGVAYNRVVGKGGDLDQQGARADTTYYNVVKPGIDQAKVTSAQQSGNWLTDPTQTPKKPYEEFTSYSGTHKGIVYHRYPDGTVKPVRKVGY